MSNKGISVVICTHNGEKRIIPVLEHLLDQSIDCISWEVIIIDNASTDDIENSVNDLWNSFVPIKIIKEERIGLSFARQKGMEEAKYPYICFVDDDNLLAANYVKLIFDIMESHPDAGAIGGLSIPPEGLVDKFWFSRYQANFAIGSQSKNSGKMDKINAVLWGAGICIRKQAWQDLLNNNFSMILTGRTGKKLISGEDSEICYALRLCGWNLYYFDQLRLVHNISNDRVNWMYLCRLQRGFGAASVYLALYRNLLSIKYGKVPIITQPWYISIINDIWQIISRPFSLAATIFHLYEGNDKIIKMHARVGRISMRFQLLSQIDQINKDLLNKYGHLLHAPD